MESEYRPRVLDTELAELTALLPAVSIDGPKGVGKTTTARQHAVTTFELDQRQVRTVVEADPNRVRSATGPVLIDEWQRLPEIWDTVRRAVDDGAPPGQFILTGSAAPANPATHSGAGRIVPLRMRPLTLGERGIEAPSVSLTSLLAGNRGPITGDTHIGLVDYVQEIVASGFPGIRFGPERAQKRLLDGYLDLVIDRDFDEAGHRVRNPAALRRWMVAYAAATATTATFETIRDAATSGQGEKPSRATIAPYRDVLERMWLIDAVRGWRPSGTPLRRLTESPKHHLADPALAARLLNASADRLLEGRGGEGIGIPRDGPLLGALFESLVTIGVRVFAQAADAQVWHLRTKGGDREVDLVVEREDGGVVGLEVKLSGSIDDDDVRHLRWLADELGDRFVDGAVICTGATAYRRRDGIAVIPAALLGP